MPSILMSPTIYSELFGNEIAPYFTLSICFTSSESLSEDRMTTAVLSKIKQTIHDVKGRRGIRERIYIS